MSTVRVVVVAFCELRNLWVPGVPNSQSSEFIKGGL
jgi:hypothetical protein